MNLKKTLFTIKELAHKNKLSEPFIVGGLPRDKVLNISRKIKDIDITTGNEDIFKLSEIIANHFDVELIKFSDKHSSTSIDGMTFDFSSNFINKRLNNILLRNKITVNDVQKELLSRDFTCNTLLLNLDLSKISDFTGLAINDINKKVIKTPLNPRVSLSEGPKRAIRAFYLASKLNFNIEEKVKLWIKNNKNLVLKNTNPTFIKTKLSSAMKFNTNKTCSLLKELNFIKNVPFSNDCMEELSLRKLL